MQDPAIGEGKRKSTITQLESRLLILGTMIVAMILTAIKKLQTAKYFHLLSNKLRKLTISFHMYEHYTTFLIETSLVIQTLVHTMEEKMILDLTFSGSFWLRTTMESIQKCNFLNLQRRFINMGIATIKFQLSEKI